MADAGTLGQVLAEDGVTAADSEPGWGAYISDLGSAAWKGIEDRLRMSGDFGWVAEAVLVVVGVGVLGFAVYLLVRMARRRVVVVPKVEVATVAEADPLAAVEALLAAGRARDAARRAWLVVAERLARTGVGTVRADQTNGEFVATVPSGFAQRRALVTLATRVDVLCYGPEEPEVAEVREVLAAGMGLVA